MSADYEIPVTTITDAAGIPLRVVRHYHDGLFFADPVRVVIYDPANDVVAETADYPDVVITQAADGSLKIFGVNGIEKLHLFQGWVFRDRTLNPNHSPWVFWEALFATLKARWLGYGFSVFLCTMATFFTFLQWRTTPAWDPASWPVLAMVWCGLLSCLWVELSCIYERLSVRITLSLCLLAALPLSTTLSEILAVLVVFGGSACAIRLYGLAIRRSTEAAFERQKAATRDQWSTCTQPGDMLFVLWDKVSERKLRLYSVACCRRIWHLLTDERAREAVRAAERFADGEISASELAAARNRARELWERDFTNRGTVEGAAYNEVNAVSARCVAWGKAGLGAWARSAVVQSWPDRAWNSRPAEESEQAALLRELFGPVPLKTVPRAPAWLTPPIVEHARRIYQEGSFEELPILADALEEAGCTNSDILDHCRGPGQHVRGCWVLDLLTGRK